MKTDFYAKLLPFQVEVHFFHFVGRNETEDEIDWFVNVAAVRQPEVNIEAVGLPVPGMDCIGILERAGHRLKSPTHDFPPFRLWCHF